MELWDFQQDVIDEARQAIKLGYKRILIVAPTGSGKTVIGAHILHAAEQKGNQSMFFAHRRELVGQTADKLNRFGVEHGIIMAGEPMETWIGTQIASVDTFRARYMHKKDNRKYMGTWKREPPSNHIVMVDEAHRACSPTYTTVLDHYKDTSVSIGLTATPVRGDGRGLGRHYDYMVLAPSVGELIKLGHLVPPRYFAPTIPDLTGVRRRKNDYVEEDLERVMDKREAIGDILTNWQRLASDRKTIVFAAGVRHSIHITEQFCAAGIRAEHVDGDTPLADRKAILDRLRSGETQVISNCMVLTEGFDCPDLEACVLARPTRNVGLFIQMAGRVLRAADGKDDALIIDHSGNIYEHGFLEDDHGWRLSTAEGSKTREERIKDFTEKDPITCVKCAHVYRGQLRCPKCGHMPEKKGKYVETRHADLMEIRREKLAKDAKKKHVYTQEEKQDWYSMFLLYARRKNNQPSSVSYKFYEKFGEWPRNMLKIEKEPTPECLAYIKHLNIKYAHSRRKRANG